MATMCAQIADLQSTAPESISPESISPELVSPIAANPTTANPAPSAGQLREQVWQRLQAARVAAYPFPPHGRHPNFVGAGKAAAHLLAHPLLANASVVLIGLDAPLAPLRGLLLAAGHAIVVPQQHHQSGPKARYWRVANAPATAGKLTNLARFGSATDSLADVTVAVLGSVALDSEGWRLSKGFGWGAEGLAELPIKVPMLSLVHRLQVLPSLAAVADSRLAGFASDEKLWLLPDEPC
jgi:5-formyltetrahydrofolate cyclo-ligase